MNMETIEGEQLTLFRLFAEKGWKIEIPIIQRDYAQGRKSTTEVRKEFLDVLLDRLEKDIPIDLDFVYGSLGEQNKSLFIPLDGQQRLTTLFLLHWYLSHKDDHQDIFETTFMSGGKSRFTYETRTSSSEFCNALCRSQFEWDNLLPPDIGFGNALSKTIQDSEWYVRSWDHDPTIQSMLNMLDAIHHKFSETEGFFDKLTHSSSPIVTFQFLNPLGLMRSDDLYIKMNSRGKQLSPFENFKAKLEQFIGTIPSEEDETYSFTFEGNTLPVTMREYFSHKIDADWANLFWNYKGSSKVFDTQLLSFIRVVATNHFASVCNFAEQEAYLETLLGKEDSSSPKDDGNAISFSRFKEMGCLRPDFVRELITVLDIITLPTGQLRTFLDNNTYYNEHFTFVKAIKNGLTYTERIRFYAFYIYLKDNQVAHNLQRWIRVIYNLTENTIYNRGEEYVRSIESVWRLAPFGSGILTYLSNATTDIKGFATRQITEERIKAHLLQKGQQWEELILRAEQHGYFKGQIGFVLSFAGIWKFYKENSHCNWTDEENAQYLVRFLNYLEKAESVFDNNGLRDFKSYVFERALLSKGNYLLSKGSNLSFLINNDRDVSWKRLLREPNDGKRLFLKNLFDDADFNPTTIETSLALIASKANMVVLDWRRRFISQPETLDYLGSKRFIRWEEDGLTIYLLSSIRRSTAHVDYYSYSFYLKHVRGLPLSPFSKAEYLEAYGDEEEGCIEITGWKFEQINYTIWIYTEFWRHDFKMTFLAKSKASIPDQIAKVLSDNGFKIAGHEASCNVSRGEAKRKLEGLLKDLGDLSNNIVAL